MQNPMVLGVFFTSSMTVQSYTFCFVYLQKKDKNAIILLAHGQIYNGLPSAVWLAKWLTLWPLTNAP